MFYLKMEFWSLAPACDFTFTVAKIPKKTSWKYLHFETAKLLKLTVGPYISVYVRHRNSILNSSDSDELLN